MQCVAFTMWCAPKCWQLLIFMCRLCICSIFQPKASAQKYILCAAKIFVHRSRFKRWRNDSNLLSEFRTDSLKFEFIRGNESKLPTQTFCYSNQVSIRDADKTRWKGRNVLRSGILETLSNKTAIHPYDVALRIINMQWIFGHIAQP